MNLDALSIATLGIGFGPESIARIGLWPVEGAGNDWLGGGGDHHHGHHRVDHLGRVQSQDEREREREELGIVERLAEVVARIEARDLSGDAEQRAIEALAAELEQEQIAWRDFYADIVRQIMRQIIDAELRDRLRRWNEEQDEEAAMLMRWFLEM